MRIVLASTYWRESPLMRTCVTVSASEVGLTLQKLWRRTVAAASMTDQQRLCLSRRCQLTR